MKKTKILMLVIAVMVVFGAFTVVLNAATPVVDTSKTGSLTITAREQNNGSTAKDVALKGVEYTLYKVDDYDGTNVTTVAQAEDAIASLTAVGTKTTGEDGIAKFESLALGRYYAKVTNVPAGTSQTPESFLVNVPMTNTDGTDWVYDVAAEPKVQTATSTITVTKTDAYGNELGDTTFKVQVSTDNGTTWSDYIPEGSTEVLTATTGGYSSGHYGQIILEDLPATVSNGKTAEFRLIETKANDKWYIIDNAHPVIIKVGTDGTATISEWNYDTKAYVDSQKNEVTIINEIPNITKYNKLSTESEYKRYSTNSSRNDTLNYKIEVVVPENIADLTTYTVVDTADAGITVDTSTIKVQTVDDGTTSDLSVTPSISGQTMTFTLTPSTLVGKDTVIITYDAKLNENANMSHIGNTNSVTLTYTNNIDVDGKEQGVTTRSDGSGVYTGGLKIHKVDADGNNLADAKFKLVLKEKDNEAYIPRAKPMFFSRAKVGSSSQESSLDFVQKDGEDYEVTTDENGYAVFTNIAHGEYELYEVESPTYVDENGVTKHYKLLTKPVSVTVNYSTFSGDAIEVVNKKELELPATGGVGAALIITAGVALVIVAVVLKKNKKSSIN